MDLWSAIFTVLRRWYVSVPILVAAFVAAFVLGGRIQPEYSAEGSAIFRAPTPTVIDGLQVPFNNSWAGDPNRLAAFTVRQLLTDALKSDFEDNGLSPNFVISLDQFTSIMDIAVTADSESQALDTVDALIEEASLRSRQIQRQESPPENEYVTIQSTPPTDAQLQAGSKTRVMMSIVILGAIAAAGAAFVLESLANRRKGVNTVVAPPGYYPAGYVPMMPMSTGQIDIAQVMAPGAATVGVSRNGQTEREAFNDHDDLDALLDEMEPEPPPKPRSGGRGGIPMSTGRSGRSAAKPSYDDANRYADRDTDRDADRDTDRDTDEPGTEAVDAETWVNIEAQVEFDSEDPESEAIIEESSGAETNGHDAETATEPPATDLVVSPVDEPDTSPRAGISAASRRRTTPATSRTSAGRTRTSRASSGSAQGDTKRNSEPIAKPVVGKSSSAAASTSGDSPSDGQPADSNGTMVSRSSTQAPTPRSRRSTRASLFSGAEDNGDNGDNGES